MLRLSVVPVRRRYRDAALDVDAVRIVGYRATSSDGFRGLRRPTVQEARGDLALYREQLEATAAAGDAGDLAGFCSTCGARNSGAACYECGTDPRAARRAQAVAS
jgi:hypothetical protein